VGVSNTQKLVIEKTPASGRGPAVSRESGRGENPPLEVALPNQPSDPIAVGRRVNNSSG